HADVGACLPGEGAVGGGEGPLVGEELDDLVARVEEGEAVGRAILETGDGEPQGADALRLVVDHAAEGDGVVDGAAVAVVEDEAPAREVGPGRPGDLDALAGVGRGVVVVDLVDPHEGVGWAAAGA